ncbi:hypothetical protein IE53DRAFT_272624 [Violaceomyces palustris]|uniref:Uncharacterized protein n=1 Tax=Violaceomyces palustris TaxID=1673888 RepID=A0ACD0NMT6_9BASI|nr:hypothetical protein IE53DRAFT_272624 [Violaceomyces palustris]
MPADVVHTDITNVSKAFAVVGGFVVLYGLLSYVVKERLYLSEPLIAVTVGIITGPYVLGWVDPLSWGSEETTNYTTYQFTRMVVGVQVLFTGISLPKAYLWREKLSLVILLFGIMTAAWFATALLIWGLIPNLTFLESLAISAAVTPTDPVLANSITTGRFAEKYVPANVRNIIVAESGANDGLGFPFLYMAIYLLARNGEDAGTSVGTEIGRWVYAVVVYQILLSICFGAVVGYLARKTLRWAESRQYIDKSNFFAYGFGLALFTLGTTGLFGSDDILACFIAGNSFTWDDWFRLRTEDNDFQEILDMLLNAAVFIYIGAIIPWADYSDHELGLAGWRVVVLALTILLLRRPPWVVAATKTIPALRNWKESAFAGWFGPIGVGAVFYIQVALRELPEDGSRERVRRLYTPIVLFCVFGSVLTHGITVPIAKLGPGVVRRTATLTQTRSFTLSKPASRINTITGLDENGRKPLNPFYSAYKWLKHVFLFWRKDSFWRKESNLDKAFKSGHLKISGPSGAVKQSEIEEVPRDGEAERENGTQPTLQAESPEQAGSGTEVSEGEAPRRKRTPPPMLELPTMVAPGDEKAMFAAPPAPPAASEPPKHPHGLGWILRNAYGRELRSEQKEASDEAERGWELQQRHEHRRLLMLRMEEEAERQRKQEASGRSRRSSSQTRQENDGKDDGSNRDTHRETPPLDATTREQAILNPSVGGGILNMPSIPSTPARRSGNNTPADNAGDGTPGPGSRTLRFDIRAPR